MAEQLTFPLVWRVKTRLPERFGQRCRMLIRSRTMNSCTVEFEDGFRAVTSRNYVRKAPASAVTSPQTDAEREAFFTDIGRPVDYFEGV